MQTPPVGVGPHALPWPKGDHYDTQLLQEGDTRNVLDYYRYWTVEAIKADLDAARQPLEIAVENLSRDFNMGTIIRNANAFNVQAVHIIGKRQWNKRGAMVTDVYMNIIYHESVAAFIGAVRQRDRAVIAVDIVPGSVALANSTLSNNALLVFGAEGPGLSAELLAAADQVVHIEQFGSTRSVNVGVASGIAMYAWMQTHALTR
jgi:tRNA G18 (ribose-2'-O)-methylase SpoU